MVQDFAEEQEACGAAVLDINMGMSGIDEKEMLLRSVQADIVQVFAGVDNALRMQTLRYAVGDYLDIIGEQRGCTRIQAAAARATVSITTNATGKSSTLAAGTAMTADGEVFYLLADALTLNGYEQTMTAEVVADRTGSAGNGLKAGTEMSLADVSSSVNSIIVTVAAAGGNEAEDDDTYRQRIRAYALARVGTGPARQYETIAKTVSSDILDAKAINAGAGNVAVYLLLSSIVVFTVIVLVDSAAKAVTILKVEPGLYRPFVARFMSGSSGSLLSSE